MDKWEYEEFAGTFRYTEQWIEFLNEKGMKGWKLISYTEKLYYWNKTGIYRKCLFKRKIQQEDGNKKTFTLTTEEVEIVKDSLWCLINEYEANDKEIYKADNLLDRIKQWQDEAKSN